MTIEPIALQADAVGVDASTFLKAGGHVAGRTIAVFDQVFYAKFSDHVLCVTRPMVDVGPLSIRTSARKPWPRCAIRPNQTVTLRNQKLVVAGIVSVSMTGALETKPTAPSSSSRRNLTDLDLRHISLLSSVSDGLLPVLYEVTAHNNEQLVRTARPLVAGVRAWLADDGIDQNLGWARRLVGFGPGLTPSGDDLLAGLMIALRRLGQGPRADALWQCIEPVLAERTNVISAALLRAAAKGNGSLAFHAALECLFEGQNITSAVGRLARQGHSSGTDALAGILLVLENEQMRMEQVD